jgi:hypothetical protein
MKYLFQIFLFESNIAEECLREKTEIDRVLSERAKLGSFLIESTERPVITNMTAFKGLPFCFSKIDVFH